MIRSLFLLSLSSIFGFAHAGTTERFGDWIVNITETGASASLTVKSGGATYVIGTICAEKCTFFLVHPASCIKGNTYPAILSNSSGATYIDLVCAPSGESYFYLLVPDETILKALVSGGTLGLAMSVGGDFNVVRFNVDDAAAALNYVIKNFRHSKKQL